MGIITAKRHEGIKINMKFVCGIITKILVHKRRAEEIKTSSHSSMGSENISGSCYSKRFFKRNTIIFHKLMSPFQYQECCMSFIHVAHLGGNVKCPQQSISSNTKQYFLFDAQLRLAAIQLTCDTPVRRQVGWIVTIHQI